MDVIPGPNGSASAVSVRARSAVDVYFNVPNGYVGGNIPVSVNTHLNGSVSATMGYLGSSFVRNTTSTLVATLTVSGRSVTGASSSTSQVHRAVASANDRVAADAENLPVGGTSSVINIDPTRPVEVRFRLDGRVSHGLYNDSGGTAAFDALGTYSFLLDGSALNLPDGFSAYTLGGEIVDNRFTPVSNVPEPAHAWLLMLGLGVVFSVAKHRHAGRRQEVGA